MPEPIVYEYVHTNLPVIIGGSVFLIFIAAFGICSVINRVTLKKYGREFRPYGYATIGVLLGWVLLMGSAIGTGLSDSIANESATTTQTQKWLAAEYGIIVDDETAYSLWRARQDEDGRNPAVQYGTFIPVRYDGKTVDIRLVLAVPDDEDDYSYTLATQEIGTLE